MVLAHVPKKDMKKARYASKFFNAAAVPNLFDTVYVAPNYHDSIIW